MIYTCMLVLLFQGCLSPPTVRCSDGNFCAIGTVCVAVGDATLCVSDAQRAACDGRPDEATCTINGRNGACSAGSCFEENCGDALVIGAEVCDDGNARGGDGCSADCRSLEVCGNDYLDAREQCDEGIVGLSRDGCTSRCQVEVGLWQQRPVVSLARIGHVIVYDAARAQYVLFGGSRVGDTWTRDGGYWRKRFLVNSPEARSNQAMVYDAKRGRTVLFGGLGNSGMLNDTWLWDGYRWIKQSPANSPPRRFQPAYAYDRIRGAVILFGGYDESYLHLSDVWEWDGSNWQDKTPAAGAPQPSARRAAALADTGQGTVLLFGGAMDAEFYRDTWLWNGNGWREVTPGGASASPSARYEFVLAFDEVRQSVLLFGGADKTDTWEWTSGAWQQRLSTSVPPARTQAAFAFGGNGEGLLFGGFPLSAGALEWIWNGSQWRNVQAPQPAGQFLIGIANDELHHRLILLAVRSIQSISLLETWVWDGSQWSLKTPTGTQQMPVRNGVAMTYDKRRGKVYTFGGQDFAGISTLFSDIWEFDGESWIDQTPAVGPAPVPRRSALLVYDDVRQRAVLMGGIGSRPSDTFTDTWEFASVARDSAVGRRI
jgi:cysteine-rich repeat protein